MATDAKNLAFARLTAYGRPLRGWHLVKHEKSPRLERDLRRLIRENGVGDVAIDTSASNDTPSGRYHRKWLHAVREWYGLPAEEGALTELSYLFFFDVSEHEDGKRTILDAGPFEGERAMFLNIQLVGSGILTVDGKTHAVGPRDAYLLNPRVRHEWTSRHYARCKAVSFAVPASLVPLLLKTSGVENGAQYA